ncbi:MAG TPA: response regulator [Methylomirabilota bacterium]
MTGSRLRVAVVDDEASVRTSLRRLLSAFDLDAETFASGQEFLDSLLERSPDCLVLDLQMPGLSGLEVQRRLAADGVRVPTIIITADDAPETRERCLSAGTAAYLCKPFDDRTLLAMVTRLVTRAVEP